MAAVFATFLLGVMPIAFAAEWRRMRRACLARVRDVQSRGVRDRQRADESLQAARRQIASLQHQLVGARLKTQRVERQFMPNARGGALQWSVDRSPLLMQGDDLPPSAHGFADTTIGH